MNSKKTFLILLLVLILLLGGASVLYNSLGQQVAPEQLSVRQTQETTVQEATAQEPMDETTAAQEQKTPAPDFTVYDAEGNEVKLSDFLGKLVRPLQNGNAGVSGKVSGAGRGYPVFDDQSDRRLPRNRRSCVLLHFLPGLHLPGAL